MNQTRALNWLGDPTVFICSNRIEELPHFDSCFWRRSKISPKTSL